MLLTRVIQGCLCHPCSNSRLSACVICLQTAVPSSKVNCAVSLVPYFQMLLAPLKKENGSADGRVAAAARPSTSGPHTPETGPSAGRWNAGEVAPMPLRRKLSSTPKLGAPEMPRPGLGGDPNALNGATEAAAAGKTTWAADVVRLLTTVPGWTSSSVPMSPLWGAVAHVGVTG